MSLKITEDALDACEGRESRPKNFFASGGRLPCLDGWRAVAILLVLGSHCSHSEGFPASFASVFQWLFDGALGVRFFFVLSGFLITLLMLRERSSTGRFSLKQFWVRRSLRILPVYYVHLATLAIVQRLSGFSLSTGQWLRAITFTYNYGPGQWLPGHIWSLCVEEQFYLIWPLVFVLVGKRKLALILLLLGVLAVSSGGRVVEYIRQDTVVFAWPSLMVNVDSLGIGCASAYFAFYCGDKVRPRRVCILALLLALAMVLVPYVLSKRFLAGVLTVPLGPMIQAAGFATLMLLSIVYHRHWSTAWLRSRAAVQLGGLSYSIYVWQQLFCSRSKLFGMSHAWFLQFPVWILLTVCVAILSFYVVEKPFLAWKGQLAAKKPLSRGPTDQPTAA